MWLLLQLLQTGDDGVEVPCLCSNIRGTNLSYLDQQGHDVLIEGRKGLAEGHQARQGGHEKRVTLGLGQNCEQGPHHVDGQTSHAEGFGQGILDTQIGKQLDGKDLSSRGQARDRSKR